MIRKRLESWLESYEIRKKRLFERLEKSKELLLKKLDSSYFFEIYTHKDVDGLTSGALILKLLSDFDAEFRLSISDFVGEDLIERIKQDQNTKKFYVILDMGSNISKKMYEVVKDNFIIIDHHKLPDMYYNGYHHINPFIEGIDGDKEATACVLTYFFINKFRDYTDLAYIPIISVKGDRQEFVGLNKEVLDIAIKKDLVYEKVDLKIYGRFSKPLYKALAYSTNFYIDNLSGNETAVIELLNYLNIPLQNDKGEWIKLEDLNDEQKKKLIDELAIRGVKSEDIIGKVVLLKKDYYTKDFDELSTIINACIRQKYYDIGIRVAFLDKDVEKIIDEVITLYQKTIINIMKKLYDNWTKYTIEKDKILIINFKDHIDPDILSVIVSLVAAKSKKDVVIGMCLKNENGDIKISARSNNEKIDVGEMLKKVSKTRGGEGGGHKRGAGETIPEGKEKEFIESIDKMIK